MEKKKKKKKCFVITPIGGENEPIRRHIDGIIDAAIIPALGDDFNVVVAHRINVAGTITKQVVSEIYKADLVIANLTAKNPNVMYELAIRHCLGAPVITIADRETDLPADIISERTIFYTNDAKGVLELTAELKKYLKKIDYEAKSSPVLTALSDIVETDAILKITQKSENEEGDALGLIIQKLNRIESNLGHPASLEPAHRRRYIIRIKYEEAPDSLNWEQLMTLLGSALWREPVQIDNISQNLERKMLSIQFFSFAFGEISIVKIKDIIIDVLTKNGFLGPHFESSLGRIMES